MTRHVISSYEPMFTELGRGACQGSTEAPIPGAGRGRGDKVAEAFCDPAHPQRPTADLLVPGRLHRSIDHTFFEDAQGPTPTLWLPFLLMLATGDPAPDAGVSARHRCWPPPDLPCGVAQERPQVRSASMPQWTWRGSVGWEDPTEATGTSDPAVRRCWSMPVVPAVALPRISARRVLGETTTGEVVAFQSRQWVT